MSTNEIGGMCGTAFECLPVCPSSIRTKLTHIYHLDDKWHNLAVGTRGRGHNWHILSICILCKYVCTQAGRGAMSRRYVVVGGICGVVGIQMEFGWMVSTQESVWQHSGMSTSSRRHWWALMQNKESQSTPIYPFCQGDTLWVGVLQGQCTATFCWQIITLDMSPGKEDNKIEFQSFRCIMNTPSFLDSFHFGYSFH